MNVNQLRKAIKVAKTESKVIYITIHNSRSQTETRLEKRWKIKV